jgi:hypothetical protein
MGFKLQTFVNRGRYTTLNEETDLFAYSRLLTELLPSRPTYLGASPINRPLMYIIVAHSVKQGNKKSVRQASSHIPIFFLGGEGECAVERNWDTGCLFDDQKKIGDIY